MILLSDWTCEHALIREELFNIDLINLLDLTKIFSKSPSQTSKLAKTKLICAIFGEKHLNHKEDNISCHFPFIIDIISHPDDTFIKLNPEILNFLTVFFCSKVILGSIDDIILLKRDQISRFICKGSFSTQNEIVEKRLKCMKKIIDTKNNFLITSLINEGILDFIENCIYFQNAFVSKAIKILSNVVFLSDVKDFLMKNDFRILRQIIFYTSINESLKQTSIRFIKKLIHQKLSAIFDVFFMENFYFLIFQIKEINLMDSPHFLLDLLEIFNFVYFLAEKAYEQFSVQNFVLRSMLHDELLKEKLICMSNHPEEKIRNGFLEIYYVLEKFCNNEDLKES